MALHQESKFLLLIMLTKLANSSFKLYLGPDLRELKLNFLQWFPDVNLYLVRLNSTTGEIHNNKPMYGLNKWPLILLQIKAVVELMQLTLKLNSMRIRLDLCANLDTRAFVAMKLVYNLKYVGSQANSQPRQLKMRLKGF